MDIQKDDYVVYRTAGVCQLVGIESQTVDGEHSVLYYQLKPLADSNSTYYIPVAKADDKIRKLLTKEEVLELIDGMSLSDADDHFCSDNRREQREMYSQILKSDDRKAMAQLVCFLYSKKQFSESHGKRFSTMDESAFKNAEALLLQEFGIVLGLSESEVRKFIADRLENQS